MRKTNKVERLVRKHAKAAYHRYCEWLGVKKLHRQSGSMFQTVVEDAILSAMVERERTEKATRDGA